MNHLAHQISELQTIVDGIYSARISRETRLRQILTLLRSYSEYEVVHAISDLIFRYQTHLDAQFDPHGNK
jgi:hypothetical protein